MFGVTSIIFRIPVIKFCTGGLKYPIYSGAISSSSAPFAITSMVQVQSIADMSTCYLSDINTPAKYRRSQISNAEIDNINNGGIMSTSAPEKSSDRGRTQAVGIIHIPQGALIDCGKKKKEEIALQIHLNIKSK